MGTLLVNERMLESYVAARDLLLKPDGWMFPSRGTIHVAPFYDDVLHSELAAKSHFWLQKNFYGINLSPLFEKANDNVYVRRLLYSLPYLSLSLSLPFSLRSEKTGRMRKEVTK